MVKMTVLIKNFSRRLQLKDSSIIHLVVFGQELDTKNEFFKYQHLKPYKNCLITGDEQQKKNHTNVLFFI